MLVYTIRTASIIVPFARRPCHIELSPIKTIPTVHELFSLGIDINNLELNLFIRNAVKDFSQAFNIHFLCVMVVELV